MNISSVVKSKSEADTIRLAADFSANVNPNSRVVLFGELGSGKTFFVKKILEQFGITEVNSPTFAIVNEYTGKIRAYHFDFYRLMNYEELLEIGWMDYIKDEEAALFIEWGDLLPQALPEKYIGISINILDEFSREFKFSIHGE